MIIAPTDVVSRLGALSDENRLRILALLDQNEFTVSDLTAVLQLPQSTVSRHLKVLVDDEWIRWRQDGTSRHYHMATTVRGEDEDLWGIVKNMLEGAPWLIEDAERARSVLAHRRQRAEEFFSGAAQDWDAYRSDLFGDRTELAALFGLLDPAWTVGDLGSGTGAFTALVAPFVDKVFAVDRSPEMLEASRNRLVDFDNVDLRSGELESLPLESGTLDLAAMILVLHYVVEPQRALEEARRCLKPGGRLLLVDMRKHTREEYRQTMGHLWTGFDQDQLSTWMEAAGFRSWQQTGLTPDPRATGPLLFVASAMK